MKRYLFGYLFGVWADTIKMITGQRPRVKLKFNIVFEAGFFYCPYIPLFKNKVLDNYGK